MNMDVKFQCAASLKQSIDKSDTVMQLVFQAPQ